VFPLKDNIPTDRFPVVTVALIAINVLMYFFFQEGGVFNGPDDANVIEYGAFPYEFTHWGEQCEIVNQGQAVRCAEDVAGQPSALVTAFTSMFMHGSILHLGGNMLFLWIFGNNVEDSMGPVKYILFYLLGGIAALVGQTLVATGDNAAVPLVGASGAIAGVLGGYLLLFPRARVLTAIILIFFFTLIEIPAMFVLGFWFVQQIAFGYFDLTNPTGGGGGVAYFAHIGGFVFGLIAIKLFANRKKEDERAWLGA
jgi:membrane associated rhomboid family serine protease